MDDGGRPGVEKMKALQNLSAPASQHLGLHDLKSLKIAAGEKGNYIRQVNGEF